MLSYSLDDPKHSVDEFLYTIRTCKPETQSKHNDKYLALYGAIFGLLANLANENKLVLWREDVVGIISGRLLVGLPVQ